MPATCYYCANPATATSALVLDGSGYLMHEWALSVADDPHGTCPNPCPPLRDGWDRCGVCEGAYPLGYLFLAQSEMKPTIHPKTGRSYWAPVRLVPLSSGTPRWWLRFEVGSRTEPPMGAKGAIFERDVEGDPYLICRSCSPSWAERDRRRAVKAIVKPDASQARVAAVPDDGPGLTRPELMTLWGLGERQTRDLAGQLVEAGSLLTEESPAAHGGSPVKHYRRSSR